MAILAETLKNKFHGLLYGNPYSALPSDFPSDRLRYIRDYGKVGVTELVSIICKDSSYNFFAPYFALKLLDCQPEHQRELLSDIVQTFSNSGSYENVSQVITSFFQTRPSIPTLAVAPNKLRQVIERGPAYVEECTVRVAKEVEEKGKTPVILGYAGLLALREFITRWKLSPILILFPDNLTNSEKVKGYEIVREDTKSYIGDLTSRSFTSTNNLGLIDNTIYTGETMKKAKAFINQYNPTALISAHPFYITHLA